MPSLFLTGATGLVGRFVTEAIGARGMEARALVRSQEARLPPWIDPVVGSLAELRNDASPLLGTDTVLHLAAATGAVSEQELHAVNVSGTEALLEACHRQGVRRFVHVSTIAVRFGNVESYPYARSKRSGEELVLRSEIDSVIVRPTIVLAPASPILEKLGKLARLPIPVVPGKRRVRVQPVDARDLASALVDIVCAPSLGRQTIELGGPETVTMGELVLGIRRASGRGGGRVLHVPLAPFWAGLTLVGHMSGGRFPVTTAQLSSFRFDGVAQPNPLVTRMSAGFHTLAESLSWAAAP